MSDYRFKSQRKPRPWPVSALARRLGIPEGCKTETSQLVLRLGIDRRNIRRYRDWGLTTEQADVWAGKAGLHPAEVWPTWTADLRGQALVNANRERCSEGHPLDLVDGQGFRRCSTCRRAQVREAVRNLRNRRSQHWITSMESAEEAS